MTAALQTPAVPVEVATAATSTAADAALALARQVAGLPPLPRAVTAVLAAMHQPGLPAGHCVLLIERDQALAARVLRLANSAFYGVPGRVASIGEAVRLLGLRQVSGVLTAAAMQGALRVGHCPGFDFEAFWRHALASAMAARALAPRAGWSPDTAFLAGLLQDIGQLAMAACMPEQAARALALAQQPGWDANQAELATLSTSHAALGAALAQHWGFPPDLVQAITWHHAPTPPAAGQAMSLSGLVRLADSVAQALDAGCSPDAARDAAAAARACPQALADPALWQGLALHGDALQQLLAGVEAGTHEVSGLLLQA